jgi:glycine betaine/proline transport system ATP-binding protein
LSQWADRYGQELSGGMQQRVGLARAFATDAEILLMDEPFSALDPLIRSKLQDELRSLQQRVRKSILFVTHDLDEALRLGDRISILEGGRIMQSGTPADIMLRPANSHVAEFVRHVNPLSVLNGSVIMRPWRDLELRDGRRWLDPARQYELLCDEQDRPIAAQFDGRTLNLCAPDGPTRQGLMVADARAPLRELIAWLQETGHPVLLTDADGICGVCGPNEVIRALAISKSARGSAVPA